MNNIKRKLFTTITTLVLVGGIGGNVLASEIKPADINGDISIGEKQDRSDGRKDGEHKLTEEQIKAKKERMDEFAKHWNSLTDQQKKEEIEKGNFGKNHRKNPNR